VLDGDPLDDVGDVLALVDRRLEETVDLLPLDDLERVTTPGEEVGNRLSGELVALVLEAVDLDPVFLKALEALEVLQRLVELLALADDDRGLLDGNRRGRFDVVQDEGVGDFFDEVQDIVQAADQCVNLLAIERRDEGCLQAMPDLVAELVPAVLGITDLAGAAFQDVIGTEHGLEQPRRAEHVRGILGEQVEEAFIAGNQAKAQCGLLRQSAAMGRSGLTSESFIVSQEGTAREVIRYAMLAPAGTLPRSQPRRSMPDVDVATLNLRNIADRWPERLPLLLADMAALQPDLLGLQECVFAVGQDRLLGAAGAGRYEIQRGYAGRPEYGNSVLVRAPLAGGGDAERLDLGRNRSALRIPVNLPTGGSLDMVVTHLHHLPADEDVREEQARALVRWLDDRPSTGGTIVVGDFNAEPVEAAYRVMLDAGFRSAHAEANGSEPAVTWPSGIQAPGMDADGEPGCLDYIWLRGPLRATASRVAFDRPAVEDPTLFPSDHLGLVARVRLEG